MMENKTSEQLRLLMVVPSYYGWSGDAVNERELSFALSRHVRYIYVITLIGLKQILTKRRKELKVDLKRNMKVIPIPMPFPPNPIVPLMMIIYSFLINLIVITLEKLGIVNAIYVRNPLLAAGLIAFRKQVKNIATVIPALVGDELSSNIKNVRLKSFVKLLCDKIDQFVIQRTYILLVHGSTLGEILKQKYRYASNKHILSVAPGVNLRKAEKIRGSVKAVEELRIGFVGSLVWWQGVDILVKAMQIVQRHHPEAKLYIVGAGPMLDQIRNLIEECDVNVVLTGTLDHDRALKLLCTFYALVIPSRSASNTKTKIPMKMVEAFALGVPVLITKHKAIVSLFKNENEVLYIDNLSPSGVAEKILIMIENPQLREKLRENGLKLANNFDYDKIVEKLIHSLKGIID